MPTPAANSPIGSPPEKMKLKAQEALLSPGECPCDRVLFGRFALNFNEQPAALREIEHQNIVSSREVT
jgi:hypothetical protein